MSVTRKAPADFDPRVLKLFDQHVHGDISRRDFLQSVTQFAVGVTALGLLDALNPRFAEAQVASNDPRLRASYVEYPSPQGYGKSRG